MRTGRIILSGFKDKYLILQIVLQEQRQVLLAKSIGIMVLSLGFPLAKLIRNKSLKQIKKSVNLDMTNVAQKWLSLILLL